MRGTVPIAIIVAGVRLVPLDHLTVEMGQAKTTSFHDAARVTGAVLLKNCRLTLLMRSHISRTASLTDVGASRSCLTISACAEPLFNTLMRTIEDQRGADDMR